MQIKVIQMLKICLKIFLPLPFLHVLLPQNNLCCTILNIFKKQNAPKFSRENFKKKVKNVPVRNLEKTFVGEMYEVGDGVELNLKKAFKWFLLAQIYICISRSDAQ